MNKIFKTKYDVTTGQTKVVSELANNRQVASRVEAAGSQPKCGVFFGGMLGAFKVLPLVLVMSGLLSSVAYGNDNAYVFDENVNGNDGNNYGSTVAPFKCVDRNDCWFNHKNARMNKSNESVILSHLLNKTGTLTNFTNKDFEHTVVVGSRAVGGGKDTTVVGYRAIVGKNDSKTNTSDSHQGTAVGYRAFSYGNESISLGNDTVAYGESSISIGSDNIAKGINRYQNPYADKPLSYDIWKLFKENSSKFNYTDEYAATDSGNTSTDKTEYEKYLKMTSGSKVNTKTHNWAYGASSIAIGSRNVAYGDNSVAMGSASIAKGHYSTALGTGTLAFGDSSVALGNEVYIYSDQSVGVGNNIQALDTGSMVYGLNSYAGGTGSIAIGTRAMSNVQIRGEHNNVIHDQTVKVILDELYDGNSTDDNNKIYNKLSELDKNKENLYSAVATKQDGTGEFKAKTSNSGAVAIGYFVIANGENSLALGRQAYSRGGKSVAIGSYAYSKGEESFALGYGSKSIGNKSFAIGSYSRADGENSIALGIESKVLNDNGNPSLNGSNSVALGNNTIATMKNSVALGYKSTTNYYYNPSDTSTHTYSGSEAIDLPGYVPAGSNYQVKTGSADGIVSVGGWQKGNEVGLRRIVGVAPGALDSDVATIGQLKALQYVNKEGIVTYYTVDEGKNIKVVKDYGDNEFYVVNTKDGQPLKNLKVDKEKVLVAAKGAKEAEVEYKGKKVVDLGEKIKFGHLLDAKISDDSDEAVTGAQLKNVGDILGISIKTSNNTQFETPSFAAVKYIGGQNSTQNNFKGAIDELITAVNKGYKFVADQGNDTYILGSTIKIVPGTVDTSYSGKNLKTKLTKEGNGTASLTAKFEIGLSDTPTFTNVTVTETTDENHVVNKKYVDGKLANVAANFTVKGDSGSGYTLDKTNTELNIKGKQENGSHKNITTAVDSGSKGVTLSLNSNLKNISSVGKDQNNQISFNGGTTTIKSNGADLTLTKGDDSKVKITGVATAKDDYDAVNYKQLKDQQIHFVSIKNGTTAKNYNNDGAKAKNAIAIGVGVETGNQAEATVAVGNNLNVGVQHSTVIGQNIKIEQDTKDNARKDGVVAIGSGLKLKNAKSSIVLGAVDERAKTNDMHDGATTVVEDASWAVVIGNKTTIKNGSDIVALGNNITVGTVSPQNGQVDKTQNAHVIILGNRAMAKNAKGSVVIGKSASSLAQGAVVIGEDASVAANAGDSVALGKGSKATDKKQAFDEATVTVGSGSDQLKVSWGNAGTSTGANDKKSVVSVGDRGAERIITNLAAGDVRSGSTDAINGGQLYSVMEVFGKLGTNVLGAEVEGQGKIGFKQSSFNKLLSATDGAQTNSPMTFKAAIDANIAKLNEGFKYKGDTGTENGAKAHYLGSTLSIVKLADAGAGSAAQANVADYQGANLITKYSNEGGNPKIEIGFKKEPTFDQIKVTQAPTSNEHVVNKKYFDDKITEVKNTAGQAISFEGNDAQKVERILGQTLKIVGETASSAGAFGSSTTIDTAPDNITVKKNGDDTLQIGLKKKITGLESITGVDVPTGSNQYVNTKIEFNDKNAGDGTQTNVSISSNGAKYTFSSKGFRMGGKNITNLKGAIENTNGTLEGILSGDTTKYKNIENHAVNVEDLSKVANAIVQKGLTFKGNDAEEIQVPLGEKITIKGDGTYLTSTTDKNNKQITFDLKQEIKNKLGVIKVEDEKIAIGKDSQTVEAEQALAGLQANVGSQTLKFDWKDAGASKDANDKRNVLSVGDTGSERIIKHVAAGKIDTGSTDAVNGGQLKSVIDVFGKLGVDVLGADVETDNGKTGFKTPKFTALKDKDGMNGKVPQTFKEAIEANSKKLNEGLTFAVSLDTTSAGGTDNSFTSNLGATITFKGDKYLTPSIDSASKTITFKVNATESIDNTAGGGAGTSSPDDNKLVTAGAVKKFLADSYSTTLKVEADNTTTAMDAIGTVNLKDDKLKIAGDSGFIETKVEKNKQTVKVKLAQGIKDKLAVVKVEDDKIAIGKDSEFVGPEKALDGLDTTSGVSNLKFDWKNAGTGDNKSVLSVGKDGAERIIKHVAAGKVDNGSTDAVNGGQLKSVIDVFSNLGLDVLGAEKAEDDKTGFKKSTFAKLMPVDGTDTMVKASDNFRDAINANIKKLNEGLKFKADMGDDNGTKTHYLGSIVSVVKLEGTPTGAGAGQPNISDYKGDNLITKYSFNSGNPKIEIGFKDAPVFSKVTLSGEQTYEPTKLDGDAKKELITKGYLEEALNSFKIKVKSNGGKEVAIGRGDTIEFKNGLNIEVNVANEAGAGSISAGAGTAPSAPASPAPVPSPSNPTTTVVATISTSKELKDLKSIEFEKPQDGKSATGVIKGLADLDSKATRDMAANKGYVDDKLAGADANRPFDYYSGDDKVVKGQDGKFYKPEELTGAKYDANSKKYMKEGKEVTSTVKDQNAVVIKAASVDGPMTVTNIKDGDLTPESKDAVNGSQLVKATGAKLIDDPDSTSDPKAKKMVFADGRDGLFGGEADAVASQGLTNKDGLNGKNANDKANALRNGEAGTVVFTDKDSNRLVKANDGKYYKATDVDDKGNVKSAANGQVAPKAVDNPQLSLVNTGGEINKPVVLSNVASGLGLTTPTDDKKETLNKLADTVKEKVKVLGEKTKELSDKATKLADLELMVDSLKQTVDTLPDGEAKDKIREELKNYEPQLSAAQKAKEDAKEAVKSARNELIEANKGYKEQYNELTKATEKVADLVKPDSKAELSNVATVGDLQAVARTGLNFAGNDGVPVHKNLGEKLTIKGEGEFNSATTAAGNIKVDASATGLEVKLSDKLKNMTSFETKETAEGNKSRLDGNGLRVTHKDGKSAQYGVDGVRLTDGKHSATLTPSGLTLTNPQDQRIEIDGEKGEIRVPDLTSNSSPNAVVNKGYVDTLRADTGNKLNALGHKLHTTDKNLRAGIAGANAAAALPTISIPGSSLLAVSAGTYKGQSAVALGYSRVSDNGKVLLKLHGNSNSVGDFGGGVGVGWKW
ncbi:YadA-like family protein [Actinobacillus seminis]|uniref:YadA-like family protein n=1 Tax=Actinobacillus seminis TaxID=722 RepID=UPI003B933099